jgi:hypothetical protein
MMVTVIGLLAIVAFITTIVAAAGRVPVWIPVLLLVIIELIRLFPLGPLPR